MGTVTKSVTVIPFETTGRTNMTTSTSYPESRGYNDTSNSSYARWTLSTSTTGYIYYKFDTSEIPAGATITSVTAKARCYVNNTTRVTNTVCQLYSGTTAKGSNATFASTSNTNIVTLSPGNSWSRSDLNDLRIRIGATGGTSTSSKYVYFAGAEVVISYSATTYDITIQNSTSATVTASESEVASGDSVEIYANTLTGLTVKDNGTDVTSQFVHGISDTMSAVPGSTFTTGFSQSGANFYQNSSTTSTSWLQYAIGHSAESPYSTSDTNNTYVKPEGATGWINYTFDFSEIPTSATINSVSVKVYGARENSTIDTSHVARFQCYSGNTAKGTLQNFTSTSNGAVTVSDVGTWTATELHDAQLRFEIGYYGGRMLGITWTVSYTMDGYVYTISNISTDHTIVVTSGGVTETLYFKNNGSWVVATKAYKKVNGSWVQQTNLTTVFDSNTNYVKG